MYNINIQQLPELHNRPAELEFVLQRYDNPQTRLPFKLPSRPVEIDNEEEEDADDDEFVDRYALKSRATLSSRRKARGQIAHHALNKNSLRRITSKLNASKPLD